MLPYLEVEAYDAAETEALSRAPNRLAQSCRPVVFSMLGYPMRAATTRAAGLFLDVMQELRTEDTFTSHLGGGVTEEEFEALRQVATAVADMTEGLYGRRRAPRASLLRSLGIVRHIRWAMADQDDPLILDIGSGSGYVGALLLSFGYRYICTDITHGFYLYQNHLFNAVTGGKVIELATDPRDFFSMTEFPKGWAVHVPWWKYVVVEPKPAFRLDAITCNHALCEMHPLSLGYTVTLAQELLGGGGFRPFLLEGFGHNAQNPLWMVIKDLVTRDFVFNHHDTFLTVLEQASATERGMETPLPNAKSEEEGYALRTYVDAGSPMTSRILEARRRIKQSATVTLADFDSMLRTVLGTEDLRSDDERFLNYIKDPRGW